VRDPRMNPPHETFTPRFHDNDVDLHTTTRDGRPS
jgi:hypothetical protein